MIKALFFDIDGTLVSFENHSILPSTIEALEIARSKGIKIFIATGRPPSIINNLTVLQERNLIDGYMTMNGAYCFVGDNIIYKKPIPLNEIQSFADICKQKNYPTFFVTEHRMALCQPNDLLKYVFFKSLKITNIPILSVEEAAQGDVLLITSFFTADDEKEVRPCIPNCEIVRWHPAFADITAEGNTKQKGIDEFIKHFGFRLEETMAFGDGGNDISMLRHAAIGVAMGQATEEVKQSADYVTSSVNDDGIWNAMKHFEII